MATLSSSAVENDNIYQIGDGLPRCISYDTDGFERLKSRLGLNRQSCRNLLDYAKKTINSFPKKKVNSGLKTSERDRLLLFELYEDKTRRYLLWEQIFSELRSGKDTRRYPSLDHRILHSYLDNYDFSPTDLTRCAEVFTEWPEISQRLNDGIPWADFAAFVWADIRGSLNGDNWVSLDLDRQVEVTLMVFSVATIVDDERILRAAIAAVPDLADEFGHIIVQTSESDSHEATGDTADNFLHQWTELCKSLRSLADSALGPPPSIDALSDIKEVVSKLSAIEPQVRERCAPLLFDHLLSRVNGFLGKLKQDPVFSWLRQAEEARLRDTWERTQKSLSLDQIREEIDRINEAVPLTVKRIHRLGTKLSEAKSQRDSLPKITEDLAALHVWEETRDSLDNTILASRHDRRQARIQLLSDLSPFGTTFKIDPPSSPVSPPEDSSFDSKDSRPAPSLAKDKPSTSGLEAVDLSPTSQVSNVDSDTAPSVPEERTAGADGGDTKPTPERRQPSQKTAVKQPTQPTSAGHPLASRCSKRMMEALNESPPQLAYAAQVSQLSTRLGITADDPLAVLLEAASLADYLAIPDGAIANALSRALERFQSFASFVHENDDVRDVHVMLALAASLRPMLLSSEPRASNILSALKPSDRLAAVYKFATSVSKDRDDLHGIQIDSTVLKAAGSEAAWKQEHEQLKKEVAEWHQRARYMTMKYAPATEVWKRWLAADGIIFDMINMIKTDSSNDVPIKEMISTLDNRRTLHHLVKETDRREIGRRRGQDIQAGALTQLVEHAQRAVSFAHRHLSLNTSQPTQPTFTIRALTKLRDCVEQIGSSAVEELRSVARTGAPSILTGAASTAAYAIDRFRRFLDRGADGEPDPNDILASALFPYPSIPVSDDGLPAGDGLEALKVLTKTTPLALDAAAEKRLIAADFKTTRRMIAWIEFNDLEHSGTISSRMDHELQRLQQDLRHDIDDTRTKVEMALSRDYIRDPERDTYDAQLVAMERRIEQSEIDFDTERSALQKMIGKIDSAKINRLQETTSLLQRSEIPPDSSRYVTILDAIERGDIITANELIDQGDATDAISSGERNSRSQGLSEFYPLRSEAVREAIESQSPGQIIQRIATADELGGMTLTAVPRDRRESSERMLTAWYEIKRAGRLRNSAVEEIKTLFSEIGFIVRDVQLTRRDDRDLGEAIVETEPLHRRERCPIPEFGSSVNGKYRIRFLWKSSTEEDILQHAGNSGRRGASIVLYFGVLNVSRRAELARIARERGRSLLVVDELLLLYLCGETGSRVPTLFACSLPFTYVQPYVTTAGLVPPEMFYGREREMREIEDPNESCFIYGGRQLGKTALLRAVENRYHRPSDDFYAVWIDLKREGVGYDQVYDQGVTGIWSAIWRALSKKLAIPGDVKDPNPSVGGRIKGLIDGFREFLVGHFSRESGRRLLLLLDEADKFLEVDARQVREGPGSEYRVSTRLKGLMDDTDRSIKVVFAGLHNVLRTAESSNHPLGHFGTPIQIGPLWRDAHALIREPLAAAGYTLENDLITRILARTNYYPHLIQIYGSELVKSMAKHITDIPPYDISEKIIDDTYLINRNLREAFRQRFRLTLQLDPRYEVIAYTVACECNQRDAVLSEGLDYRRIDEESRGWWSEGFEDVEPRTDRFRSLLDEMVGLGVLRKVGDHRYTLRNPNVLMLMGTAEEIEEHLLKPRELPQEVDPATFRAHDPRGTESPSRSPLTYQQEGSLRVMKNGVSILCGLPASGYEDVLRFLKREKTDPVILLEKSTDHHEFEDELVRSYERRSEGTTIYVIPATIRWSKTWVERALERVRGARGLDRQGRRDKSVRVLFMADAARLLQLDALDDLNLRGLEWVPLRPWRESFLLQWIADLGFPDAAEKCPKIVQNTGGWWALLRQLYNLVRETGSLDEGLERLEEDLRDLTNIQRLESQFSLDILGSKKNVLCDLAQFKAADLADLRTLAEDHEVDESTLMNILRWAELLHIVRRRGPAIWEIDGVVGRLLTVSNE